MPVETTARKTRADFERLPEGTHCQLIAGEIISTPTPPVEHRLLVGEMIALLHEWLRFRRAGRAVTSPVDVYLADDEAYQPDIVVLLRESRGRIEHGHFEGPPDLVVEVLSPSNAGDDLVHKKRVYERSGVREYWIADPREQTVEVFVLEGGRYRQHVRVVETGTATSVLLSGFTVDAAALFAAAQPDAL